MAKFSFSIHDNHPEDETRFVDSGLAEFNDQAAPLHEVEPISCFARDESGRVMGGAIGRWWGRVCELQQLWVEEQSRGQGLGAALVREFEAHAMRKGCTSVHLETFSFQAPSLYRSLGYEVAFMRTEYPHAITKFYMVKHVQEGENAA